MRDLPPVRSLETIRAELLAANTRVAQLEIELAEATAAQRQAVIKAFDDGARRSQIVAATGLTYQVVSNILHKAGRSERQRQALGLTLRQEAEYRRLTREGVPSKVARKVVAGRKDASLGDDLQGAQT